MPTSGSKAGETTEQAINRLEAENLMLRERLALYEASEAAQLRQQTPTSGGAANKLPTSTNSGDDLAAALAEALPSVSHFAKTNLDAYDELPTYPDRPHFDRAPHHPGTQCVVFNGCSNDPYQPSSMPIYQTATFVQPNIEEFGPYDYTRSGNPTRTAIEVLVAKLEGAHSAFAFTSGMSALSCIVATLSHGDHILAMSDLYGGMHRLLTQVTARFGVDVTFIDTSSKSDDAELRNVITAALVPGRTKLIHVESPSNPLMKITDLKRLAAVAAELGLLVSVDNTMMTPCRCLPLQLGCHIVMHSGTKFFSGHSDTMSGFVAVRDPEMARRIAFLQNAQGTALAPFDSWLVLRGMKTLSLRVERQEVNAIAVGLFLCRQTKFVKRLHFAGVDPRAYGDVSSLTEADFILHHSQTTGPGSVISFETGDSAISRRFVDACTIFKLTVSFGSCNSLVEMPCLLSHASIPKEKRTLPEDLIRLSIGIEHVEDLIRDLAQAVRAALK